jgi:hypothetical protein
MHTVQNLTGSGRLATLVRKLMPEQPANGKAEVRDDGAISDVEMVAPLDAGRIG